MTGIITLSSSWPASQAAATVASHPVTWKHTWLTISGTDGFTLPGMIDEPGCAAGTRPHAEQAQVAGDLAQFDGQPADRTGVGEDVSHALRDAEAIGRPDQRQRRRFAKPVDRPLGEPGVRVEAGADGRGAQVQLEHPAGRALEFVRRMQQARL